MLFNYGVGEDYWEFLGLQGDQTIHSKGIQFWIFIGRTDAEADTPVLCPSDAKNGLIEKDPDAGKDWRHEEKGTTEDKMVGCHHQLKGHGFEQAQGDGDRETWCAAVHGVADWTRLSYWTTTLIIIIYKTHSILNLIYLYN